MKLDAGQLNGGGEHGGAVTAALQQRWWLEQRFKREQGEEA